MFKRVPVDLSDMFMGATPTLGSGAADRLEPPGAAAARLGAAGPGLPLPRD